MKKFKQIFIIALTLVIAVGSFFLPDAILKYQDRKLEKLSEEASVEAIDLSLVSELDILSKLSLVSSSSSSIELGNTNKMDSTDAVGGAEEFLSVLDISLDGFSEMDITKTAHLVFGADGSSVVVWELELYGDDISMSIIVDDESSKVLAMQFYGDLDKLLANSLLVELFGASASVEKPEVNTDSSKSEAIVVTFSSLEVAYYIMDSYYGLTVDEIIPLDDTSFLMSVSDSKGNSCRIPVGVPDSESLYFNFYWQ